MEVSPGKPEGRREGRAAVFDMGTPVFGATGSFRIRVENHPLVREDLREQVLRVDDTLDWSMVIHGGQPMTYRWFFPGQLEAEGNNGPAAVRIINATESAAGWYQLVDSHLYGAATGPVARPGSAVAAVPAGDFPGQWRELLLRPFPTLLHRHTTQPLSLSRR